MIPIENKNARPDWNAIRAEYIGGATSYRKLAGKYQVSFTVLKTRAKKEDWPGLRTQAEHKAATEATQKVAEASATNAALAEDIKHKLLLRLKRIEEKYPLYATEVRTRVGNSTAIYRIRDLTAAYKELTEDMQTGNKANNELLEALLDLERRAQA